MLAKKIKRFINNLRKINRLKALVDHLMDQNGILNHHLTGQQQYLDNLQQQLKRINMQNAQDLYQLSLSLQYRVDQFIFDSKTVLKNHPESNALKKIEHAAIEPFYASLYDHFSGDREAVKKRLLSHYFPAVSPVLKKTPAAVFDMTCGGGEWIELLKENSCTVSGVSQHAALTSIAVEHGMEVTTKRPLDALQSLENNAYDLISGFFLSSGTLSLNGLLNIVQTAKSKLKKEGLLLLGTDIYPALYSNVVDKDMLLFLYRYCNFGSAAIHAAPKNSDTGYFIIGANR